MSEEADLVWEKDDWVRRTVVLPVALAERLAAVAEARSLSVSDLLAIYAEEGLQRDAAAS
jgi:CopG antitoxin of type II toxin-antitoxin system